MTLPYRDPSPVESGGPFDPAASPPFAGELLLAGLFTVSGLGLWWLVGEILAADLVTIVRAIG